VGHRCYRLARLPTRMMRPNCSWGAFTGARADSDHGHATRPSNGDVEDPIVRSER